MHEHPNGALLLNAFHTAHQKCVSVIQSCKTYEQIKVAEQYTKVFWRFTLRTAAQLEFDPGLGLKLTLENLLSQKYLDLGFDWEVGEDIINKN